MGGEIYRVSLACDGEIKTSLSFRVVHYSGRFISVGFDREEVCYLLLGEGIPKILFGEYLASGELFLKPIVIAAGYLISKNSFPPL